MIVWLRRSRSKYRVLSTEYRVKAVASEVQEYRVLCAERNKSRVKRKHFVIF